MFFETTPGRRCSLLLLATLFAALSALATERQGWAKTPVKARLARRSFDFERPKPGEMLPNPLTGDGAPPTLSQFVPSSGLEQAESNGAANNAYTSATSLTGSASDGNSADHSESPSSPPINGLSAAPPVPSEATTSQIDLARRIARLGIEASSTGIPDADPALGVEEKRSSALLQQSLATSFAQWRKFSRQPEPAREESLDVQMTPGQVILRHAPARLTGALESLP